jgi:hypothetical protein
VNLGDKSDVTRFMTFDANELCRSITHVKETLLALVRDLFTFSSKIIKRFIIV